MRTFPRVGSTNADIATMLRARSAWFQTTILALIGRSAAHGMCTILERLVEAGGRAPERKRGSVALCEPANLALSGRRWLPWHAHGHPSPPTWMEPMHKIRAFALGLLFAGTLAACTGGGLATAPEAPRFDGGGTYGSGGRSATEVEGGTATTSSTCEAERGGGTYGSGGRTEPCPTEPTP